MIIVSVSTKKYRKTSGKRAKRYSFLYYIDNNGNFRCKKVNKLAAIFYKLRKKHKIGTCPTCNRAFYSRTKKNIICPYCIKE